MNEGDKKNKQEHNSNHFLGHNHNHSHHHHYSAEGDIKTAFFLNLIFIFIELAGGFFTNSFAIVSDAIHDLGDCAAIGCAWVLEKISKKEADENYTYGYKRYSLVSALITSVILVAGSVGVVIGAIQRFGEPKEINGLGMLVIAVFGVTINGVAAFKTSKGDGISERAINLHMLEDVFGWLSVLIGSVFIYAFEWYFVDSLLSFVIAVFLLVNAFKHIAEVLNVLLEKKPKNFDLGEYKEKLQAIEGVESAHHVHIWSLDGESILATVHLKPYDTQGVKEYARIKSVAEEISREYGIHHLTVQFDFGDCCQSDKCEL